MKTKRQLLKRRLALAIIALVVATVASDVPAVIASHLNAQINDLSQQNADNSQAQDVLEVEAANLGDKISRLRAEIAELETQIQASQAKSEDVQRKITVAEAELARQKGILGQSIKTMYVEGNTSTLEMLASSKNLSDFVDKREYSVAVQSKIKSTLDEITALRVTLQGQKQTLDQLIADQLAIQTKLDSQRAEQNQLLALNQSQQAAYEQEIKSNNAKIASLKSQQAAENAKLFGTKVPQGVPGGGGYPGKWAFAPIDSMIDSWGMYNRECVSYTAWKVWSTGRYMPYWGGRGNAKQWDDNARSAGIPVDSSPKVGDVAISNNGTYGHSMYVEQVADDGSIYISDYNQQFDGNYREYWIAASTVRAKGLVFIHF